MKRASTEILDYYTSVLLHNGKGVTPVPESSMEVRLKARGAVRVPGFVHPARSRLKKTCRAGRPGAATRIVSRARARYRGSTPSTPRIGSTRIRSIPGKRGATSSR